jgi:tryptophan 2,3-dioxygenase
VTTDYAQQVLSGTGENDYTRYMRIDDLLSLQRLPEEVIHRDELLFQVVHQSTELWLKLACSEIRAATGQICAGRPVEAVALLGRARLGIRLITEQLDMMRHLSPWDFQTIRTVLGHGSGADSPGWLAVQLSSRDLGAALSAFLTERGVDLVELYRDSPGSDVFRLAEAMIDWDEQVSLWRARHYKMAMRVIGQDSVGTQGMPVDALAKLVQYRMFPELWEVRSRLTRIGPMGDRSEVYPV